jgi:hypothetical protein
MKKRQANKLLADALNVLIWKLPPPYGYPKNANFVAQFYIAELVDKDIVGLNWKNEQFFIQPKKR